VPDSRMIKYGGNTSCIEVDFGGRVLIIDAGTGIRKLGEELIKRNVTEMDLFITHTHWDHIQGFPFFKPIYNERSKINIIGCAGSYNQIKSILLKQMSYEFFPVRFSDLKSKITFDDSCNNMKLKGKYKGKVIVTNHPIYTLGIRLEDKGKVFVFLTDNELDSEKPVTKWQEFVEFAKGADYLVHDAQFTEAEYEKTRGWGHSTFEQVMRLAKDANVKNLGFYHHDPDRKDEELERIEKKYKNICKKENLKFKVFAVKEHDEINLNR
jgi:phosphoribosyl 1,2-cyclic phosphodiesterase